MKSSAALQLLACLVLYASCAHAIMVKFGTKGGPIEPPPPEHVVPPAQPYRVPAPVWEDRGRDTPDPNAQWRPKLFVPQPRYTEVIYSGRVPISNAQRFVNKYIPQHLPIQAEPVGEYFTPAQVLSSQNLPGFGRRYFLPTYRNSQEPKQRLEDAAENSINSNNLNERRDPGDLEWQIEKDITRRNTRNTREGVVVPYVYQFPAYVSRH